MGYFSNGDEGRRYANQFCDRCVHDSEDAGCPVMNLHRLYNSEGAKDDGHFLHMLIPLSADGVDNEQCKMFIERMEPSGAANHD